MPYGTDILGDEIGGRDLLRRGSLRLRRLSLPAGGLIISGHPVYSDTGVHDIQNPADAASNQVVIFRSGDRVTPTDDDEGYLSFFNDDSTGTSVEFARFTWIARDVSDTIEDAALRLDMMYNGTLTQAMLIDGGGDLESVMLGIGAGDSTTTAKHNILIGFNAGTAITEGSFNTCMGWKSGLRLNTGTHNTLIGKESGQALTSGIRNFYLGFQSGFFSTTAGNNVGIGFQGLAWVTDGTFNQSYGAAAGGTGAGGSNLTTGDFNLLFGAESGVTSGDQQSSMAFGYRTLITANNQLVMGSQDPSGALTEGYFGQGVVDISPAGFIFHSTGGSGTNNAGGPFTIAGGKGTGNAAGGDILFQTSTAGASGTTLQSLSTVASIVGSALQIDTINEHTSAAGVTIDGLLIKDSSPDEATIKLWVEAHT